MEMLTMICEKLWIVMMLAAFFICLAKGWLRKGFYITREQKEENEYREKLEKEKKRQEILNKSKMSCGMDMCFPDRRRALRSIVRVGFFDFFPVIDF